MLNLIHFIKREVKERKSVIGCVKRKIGRFWYTAAPKPHICMMFVTAIGRLQTSNERQVAHLWFGCNLVSINKINKQAGQQLPE